MELRDLIVTPIIIIIVYGVAYFVRPYVTDGLNWRYFMPGLTVKMIGAIALGVIYQFYYGGGDTLNYQVHGSRVIWNAFMDSPSEGMKLLFADGKIGPGLYDYAESIWYFRDQKSYSIIRIATIFDLLTFSTYSATAVLFAVVSFAGAWMLFLTFYEIKPQGHLWLAVGCLFIPSVVFWGSGILKDSITLACLGFATFSVYHLMIKRKIKLSYIILLLISIYIIYAIKKYILITYLPATIVWVFAGYLSYVRSQMLKLLMVPFMILACGFFGYIAIDEATRDDPKYALSRIGETARVTAYDIRYWTGKDAGSGYSLGELDGSLAGMLRLAPGAINVALFRPYLWEVRNPMMLLSAFESLVFLLLSLVMLYRARQKIISYALEPTTLFCLLFTLIFSFAVGVSTYNFGTLSRYKVPFMPFFAVALVFIELQIKERPKASTAD